MKKKRRLRRGVYDFIIYSCLFGAILCLLIGSKSYIKYYDNKDVIDVVKQAFLSSPKEEHLEEQALEESEPTTIEETDKNILISNYFNNILDRITTDELIPYETILTWHNYSIQDLTYIKEITDNYYEYSFNLYLNKDAILPCPINKELSNEDHNTISLNVFILEKDGVYIVKKIDPTNK